MMVIGLLLCLSALYTYFFTYGDLQVRPSIWQPGMAFPFLTGILAIVYGYLVFKTKK